MHHRRTGPDLETISQAPSDPTTDIVGVDANSLGTRSRPRTRRRLAVLALTVVGALVVALALVVYAQADLRGQRNDLRRRLAGEQRVADILSKSLLDLQKASNASYAGGGVFVLPTTGTLRAAIAVVYTQNPGAAQPSVWLLLQATGADPHVVYTFGASACNADIQFALAEGSPRGGDLQFAATNVNLPPDHAPYGVVLLGRTGPLGGVKLASDRTVSVLPSGTFGC